MRRPKRCDDDWWEARILGVGQAHAVSGDGDRGDLAGRLLLPDPEQRHVWREHYVYRPSPPRPVMGFQRPTARR